MASRKTYAAAGAGIFTAAALTIGFTMEAEGWRTTPYKDVTGKWTVCSGETHDVDPNRTYTDVDCFRMLLTSLVTHGVDIDNCLPRDLPGEMHAAFLDLSYNIGASRFCSSSVARQAQLGNYHAACDAILLYKYAGGKDCSDPDNNCYGLWLRRQAEHRRCDEAFN